MINHCFNVLKFVRRPRIVAVTQIKHRLPIHFIPKNIVTHQPLSNILCFKILITTLSQLVIKVICSAGLLDVSYCHWASVSPGLRAPPWVSALFPEILPSSLKPENMSQWQHFPPILTPGNSDYRALPGYCCLPHQHIPQHLSEGMPSGSPGGWSKGVQVKIVSLF